MRSKRFVKLCTLLLCGALLFSDTAAAAEIPMETEAVSSMPEKEKAQDKEPENIQGSEQPETEIPVPETEPPETELLKEGNTAETEMIPETEAVKADPETEAVQKEKENKVPETEAEKKKGPMTITGFEVTESPVAEAVYYYYDKPSLSDAIKGLPQTLSVYLDGMEGLQEIPVTWECVGDYEGSALFYYQFDPVWNTEAYPPAKDLILPYAAVKFTPQKPARRMMLKAAKENTESNELKIFRFLTENMRLNAAAACGIMANIYCESCFYADIEEYTSSPVKGYGLCQWTGSRRTDLENYCKAHGLDCKTVDSQMQFLEYDLITLFPGLLDKLQNTPDTKQGAYEAGYNWCYYYERPYNYKNVSVTRGNLSRDAYWPVYSVMPKPGGTVQPFLKLLGESVPGALQAGSSFSIRGSVTSDTAITSVTVGVYDINGKMKIGKTVQPNTKLYSLANVDEDIVFSRLTAGTYYYRISAASGSGKKTFVNKVFHVLANGRTVADGAYELATACGTSYLASIHKTTGNLELAASDANAYTEFQVTHKGNGWYTIRNKKTGKYIYVEGGSAATSAKVYGDTKYTLWQILPTGKGSYCLVPQCATANALDVTAAKAASGTNIKNYTANLTNAQCWLLQKPVNGVPSIKNRTVPSSMMTGSSFSIRGVLSCDIPIKTVTVGVYDATGRMKIGKSASPGTKTYDVQALDYSIVFGKLVPGVYRYKITAVTAKGTFTPVEQTFAVLGRDKTVANGTYQLLSAKNNNYAADVKGSSKAENASIVLNAKGTGAFQKYTFTYQSAGYYKIKNNGSGKYLTIAGQRSAASTDVTLTGAGTLWQVLPDGSGNYYLVPKCANLRSLDVKSGTMAAGTNIQIYTHNQTPAQRWKLQKEAVLSISGHKMPVALKKGQGFIVEGIVRADQILTSVTAGVYDASGKMKIGRTAKPNANSYDLDNMDAFIRFGTLAAGGYTYKITATAGGTTRTLASQSFVVLANDKTVANGTYRIVCSKNTGYDLITAGSSKASGAAIQLVKASGKSSEKFQFIYQNNGNYKIKNMNSGLFLTSDKKGTANGTAVIQSSQASLWQVLPDGTGAYFIVPSFATYRALDLSGGKVENNRKIQLYSGNGTAAQRWYLK